MNKFFPIFLVVILLGVGCSPVYVIEQKNDSTNVFVASPVSQEIVSNPIRVIGQARVFENVVSWRLRDSSGEILTNGIAYAAAPDMGQFGLFDFWITVPAVTDKNVVLEVFHASAKDGSDTDLVSVPLILERIDSTEIKLYFHDEKMNPEITCVKTFPVVREVSATDSIARAALVALLNGPTLAEQKLGYSSMIPFNSYLKDLKLTDGVLTVDLAGAIDGPIGGSCFVGAVRSEIENTAKQFDSVKEVKILIDGEENRLEP